MKDKESVEAVIQDLSTDGRGVAKIEGKAYFISQSIPGDRVRLRLFRNTKPPSGSVEELLSPSPHRVPHPCPHAAQCQGSIWGHLDYKYQLEYKNSLVARTLRKVIGDVSVCPTIGSPKVWNYRNRLSFSVWIKDGRLNFGYQIEARKTEGLEIETCKLGAEEIDRSLAGLTIFFREQNVEKFSTIPRRLQIHDTAVGAGALLIFGERIQRSLLGEWEATLSKEIFPGGLWMASGTKAGVIDTRLPVWRGKGASSPITFWLGTRIDVHPAVFCQTNYHAADLVLKKLRSIRQNVPYEEVWDLYGGYGALGMALAGEDTELFVLESSPHSEIVLRELAARTKKSNFHFVCGDLLSTFPRYAPRIGTRDAVILDPPRSGVHPEIIEAVVQSKSRSLFYLSCNPARLARDLSLLISGGFRVEEIEPFDFFPQTPETEVLVQLSR